MSPSGAGFSVSKTSKETSAQNVHFVDGDTPWSYDIAHQNDATTQLAGFTDAQLGDFLSRPLKLFQFSWTPETQLFERFNPWEEFFFNEDVKDKLNRFRNLRCNLKLKVLVNGNSFYYGRALLSYNPYTENDDITLNRAFFQQDLIQASQKPHILLDPCSSQGGEMTLPFIWPENYLDITRENWPIFMGDCVIHDFDVLRHANGGTDPITVSIFAWVENLTLAVPTTSRVQSGKTDRPLDEFGFPIPFQRQSQVASRKKQTKKISNTVDGSEFKKDGLISKPASAIAKAADALSMIPMFSPYAKATSMVAEKIGQVARIFGYSRPQVLEDTRSYVPRFVGNLANSDAAENLVKLSLDSKNELSIDTRIMGLGGHDELTVNSIAQRPSFWRQFDWPESATADTLLASMEVSPHCIQTLFAAPVVEYHMTALAFAVAPFEAWQGTIKYRFNVVCSEYHRGRLRLVYEPRALPLGAVPYNQTYSTIIDITEDRDFEYEVKWADVRAWGSLSGASGNAQFSTFSPATGGNLTDNGTLSVYVVNELATPSTTPADVKIQVWVSAGDDFAVSIPAPTSLNTASVFQLQADVAPEETLARTTDMSNAPTHTTPVNTFGTDGDMIKEDNQYLVYQGERIVSFRELLRRYQYHYSYYPFTVGEGSRNVTFTISDFPFYRGFNPNGFDQADTTTGGTASYNFCTMTLLNYLTPAFACRRGSLRHKAMVVGSDPRHSPSLFVARHDIEPTTPTATAVRIDMPNLAVRRRNLQSTMRTSLGGTHVTPVGLNPVLEYETPFYSFGERFTAARDVSFFAGNLRSHDLMLDVNGSDTSLVRIDKYISIGEDFQLGMFVGAPVLHFYVDPEAA